MFTEPIQKLPIARIYEKRYLSYTKWENMGFSRGTLHYTKQNAKGKRPFTLNIHVKERLEVIE